MATPGQLHSLHFHSSEAQKKEKEAKTSATLIAKKRKKNP